MHSEVVNKTRYDDWGKLIKQTSFTVKNQGENLLKKKTTIVKRNLRSSTRHLFVDSIILVDEFTAKTLYRFKIFEHYNIWKLHPQI